MRSESTSTTELDRVVKIFADLFVHEGVQPDDDFFQLGGDSLLAADLMAGVERVFGVTLPVSVLLEAPTPQSLAEAIESSSKNTLSHCMVPIRSAGSGPPVFCVHGMTGDVMGARSLAMELGRDRPFFGFRAAGLQDGERPGSSVPGIAKSYLEEAAKVAPRGPYIMMGHCGGSMIAYEMAQQLVASGETVSGLILIDPAGQDYIPWLTSGGMTMRLRMAQSQKTAEELRDNMSLFDPLSGEKRRKAVTKSLKAAIGAYLPEPYPGDALLVYTIGGADKFLNPKYGFPRKVEKLQSTLVDGPHDALFTTYVGATARAINAFLSRVAPLNKG
jgi:acyl carrier protein